MGTGFLALRGYLCSCEFFLAGGSPCSGRGSRLDLHLLLLPPSVVPPLYISSASLQVILKHSCYVSSCNFGISVGGDELWIFLLHYLVSDPRRRLCDGNVFPFIMFTKSFSDFETFRNDQQAVDQSTLYSGLLFLSLI